MENTFTVTVITPVKIFCSIEDASEIKAHSDNGEFGVLSHHKRMYSKLSHGRVIINSASNKNTDFFIKSGFLQINEDGCKIFVDHVYSVESVDKSKLKQDILDTKQHIQKVETQNDITELDQSYHDLEVLEKLSKYINRE